jgi:hypothetical protein
MTTEKHYYHNKIIEQYGECQYIQGHISKGSEKNPIWIVNENGKERFLMYCEPGAICILCRESYQKIIQFEKEYNNNQKLCFSKKTGTNYIRTPNSLYIHQIIMNWYGHGSGTANLSVDHIDRNPLNNTLENLRIATGEQQRENAKGNLPNTKKDRQHQARKLPEGIKQEDMPRYVNYNVNCYGKKNEFLREFFRIENHPTLNGKVWSSTTKQSVSIQDKLNETKQALVLLDNGIIPERKERILPNGVTFYFEKERPILAWQKKINDKTLTKKMTLDEDYYEMNKESQEKVLQNLNKEVIKKYGNEYSIFDISDEKFQQIQEEKNSKLPTYVRTQLFGEDLYLVYNKNDNQENRLTSTIKLPKNYNINKELFNLNKKIVEKYGEEHKLLLENFPYNPEDQQIIELPPNTYLLLKCKNPYILIQKENDTYSMNLPEKYCLKTQLELFNLSENQIKDPILDIGPNRENFYENGRRPENISICFKENKYYQLQYKAKTKEYTHDKTKTLPKISFNMNLELINFNKCIVEKFGKEYGFLQTNYII